VNHGRKENEIMQFNKRIALGLLTGECLATASGSAAAIDPESPSDRSWKSLNGAVVSTTSDSFRRDYGEGIVTVDMDDRDWYPESAASPEDKEVTVTGRIDDDLNRAGSRCPHSVHTSQPGSERAAPARRSCERVRS
jgi:hypothetical protein